MLNRRYLGWLIAGAYVAPHGPYCRPDAMAAEPPAIAAPCPAATTRIADAMPTSRDGHRPVAAQG